jgi:hypothetical protein
MYVYEYLLHTWYGTYATPSQTHTRHRVLPNQAEKVLLREVTGSSTSCAGEGARPGAVQYLQQQHGIVGETEVGAGIASI